MAQLTHQHQRHVARFLSGAACEHRKYGESYDTYATLRPWHVRLPLWLGVLLKLAGATIILCTIRPGAWRAAWEPWRPCAYLHTNLFGFVQQCDLCHAVLWHWRRWWEPPILPRDACLEI